VICHVIYHNTDNEGSALDVLAIPAPTSVPERLKLDQSCFLSAGATSSDRLRDSNGRGWLSTAFGWE